ncbi:MAG: sodium:proton antiporter [Thermoplasmata archaeon]|nr:MAG: sodium:proton antiporter [Thermoplasmata archaeon]MCD6468928.1 sodium:proton antiporter [Thermoplasmata archaeon]RLF27045.1 MAG: sodium:proton antiporter [Thermoplasmata archaeon]
MDETSKIIKTVSSVMFPFVTIYGLYVILHGHLTPGGGFQGGAIVASGCALLVVAFGSDAIAKRVKESQLSLLESIGALGFISLAFVGIATTFFYNSLAGTKFLFGRIPPYGSNPGYLSSGGLLPLMNLAVGTKVIAGLFAIVLILAIATRKKGGRSK